MFRWERPPCEEQEPKWQGVPTSPHTTTVSQQLLLFSNHSLHAAWLIIHFLRAMQQAFMYITPPLCLSFGPLPFHHTSPFAPFHRQSSRHHHMIPGSPSFAVCVVYSSHSALVLSIIIRQNQRNSTRQVETWACFASLFFTYHFSTQYLCSSHVNQYCIRHKKWPLNDEDSKLSIIAFKELCVCCTATMQNKTCSQHPLFSHDADYNYRGCWGRGSSIDHVMLSRRRGNSVCVCVCTCQICFWLVFVANCNRAVSWYNSVTIFET